MIVKLFEIRDRGTFIPAMAVKLGSRSEPERFLLDRGGFGSTNIAQHRYVIFLAINGSSGEWSCDSYEWTRQARTLPEAHRYIEEHFDELESGAVIDVEFVLGETTVAKTSEALLMRGA